MDDTPADMDTGVKTASHVPPVAEMEIKPDQDTSSGEPPCADQPLSLRIEALLLSSDRPLPEPRIGDLLGISGGGTVKKLRAAIDELNAEYGASGRSFRVEKLAGGWQILTQPQFGPLLARLHTERQSSRLSHAALETLAIVAYRQPIIRAEIEAIRGVACGEVLRGLLERRLIKITGRSEDLGRPMLYGTTREFLKVFGLSRIDDLPEVEGLAPPSKASKTDPPTRAAGEEVDESSSADVEATADDGTDDAAAPTSDAPDDSGPHAT